MTFQTQTGKIRPLQYLHFLKDELRNRMIKKTDRPDEKRDTSFCKGLSLFALPSMIWFYFLAFNPRLLFSGFYSFCFIPQYRLFRLIVRF